VVLRGCALPTLTKEIYRWHSPGPTRFLLPYQAGQNNCSDPLF